MNGLLDYQCQVYESGYEIVTIDEFQEERIGVIPGDEIEYKIDQYIRPIDPQSTRRVYNFMEYAGAYYEFAYSINKIRENKSTTLTMEHFENHIIKFANKYGLLTTSDHGDDKVIWVSNITYMGLAIDSLQKINNGDIEGLKSYLINEGGKFHIKRDPYSWLTSDDRINIPIIGQTPPRNYSEAAHHYISHLVNINLKDSLVTEIVVNLTNTGTDMIVRPKNLLSALWLQLAHAANRNLEFKQCSDCSTFFEVKSKKRRFEKIYCSDKCRKRVSARKRREKEKAK